MAKQTINYGTPPAGADGDTVPAALAKMESNFTEVYGRIVGKGYINGLQMQWVSATALTITSGAAYIQGTGTVLFSDSDIAKTALSLSASTWYHVYVYNNAGAPDFVLSTTAPATAYNGTARSMTGDTNKRYVGSVKTDASGNIYKFSVVAGNLYRYADSGNASGAPFRVLSAGSATTVTDVDLSSIVPGTATATFVRLQINAGSYAYLAPGGATGGGNPTDTDLSAGFATPIGQSTGPCRLGNGVKVAYIAAGTSPSVYLFVLGYYVER